ncbi:MAG: Lrp/AsnC family transcriptional regulator [Pirellulaceae bacterium]|nr:Lrp/AsnC family transcriptional regulator [Pirellulaceae bacterium]
MLEQSDYKIDRIDAALLEELQVNARIGVVELSRRLEIARGTVQTRIDRLVASGVIRGFTANLNLEAIGYHVKAYITVEVKEGQIDSVVDPLNQINEVVEVHSVAAQGDLLCLVVARSNQNLMEVLEKILSIPDIARTSTAIVLKSQTENRCHQLLRSLGEN